MKKHPTPILLLLCTILLIGGTAVAYCLSLIHISEPTRP